MANNVTLGSDNRRKLYNTLVNDGFDLGSFDDFNSNINNKDTRKSIYDAAKEAGWEMPDYGQFDKDMNIYRIKVNGRPQEVDQVKYDDFMRRHPNGSNRPQDAQKAFNQVVHNVSPKDSVNAEDGYTFTQGGLDSLERGYPVRAVYPNKPQAAAPQQSANKPQGIGYTAPLRPELSLIERREVERQNNFAARAAERLEQQYKEEENRRNQPMVDTGIESANRGVIKTRGQWEDELNAGVKKLGDFITPMVGEAIKKADDTWLDTYTKFEENFPQFDGNNMTAMARANEATDPDKILEGLLGDLKQTLDTPEMKKRIKEGADAAGIPVDEYSEQMVAPALMERLVSEFQNTQIARRLPKNTGEYILQGLNNSIIGMLVSGATKTQSQRRYDLEAEAMTEQGQNGNYQPGTGANLARMGVTFAADAPFFGLYGKVGGNVVKSIAERQIKNMLAKGLSEGAARSIVGTALEKSAGTRMKNYIMQHVISGSITMGGFNTTSEAVRQMRDSEFKPEQILTSGLEGVATGAAFGLTGGAAQAITQPLTGIAKVGGKIAGFGAEAETLYATEELAKMAHGEDGFTNPFEGSVEALEKLGVMKLSSGHLIGRAANKIARAKEVGVGKAAAETLAGMLGRTRTGVSFTKEEEAYIRNTVEGKNLIESLMNMHPERAIEEINGKKKFTAEGEQMRQQLANNYDDFMQNSEIPYDVKRKVAATLGGLVPDAAHTPLEVSSDIIHNPDGSVILKTRDKDGNCIRDYKFDSFSDAEGWREAHEEQFRLNDAVNMWNESSLESRSNMIGSIMETYQVDAKEARQMVDAALGGSMGTSFDNDMFLTIYSAIHSNAYPASDYNPKRNYWEGMRLDPEQRHQALEAARQSEETLQSMGTDFADEVIGAADFADEKLAQLAGREDITGEQLQAAISYYNWKSFTDGMMDEAAKDVDSQVEAANNVVRRNTHPDTGRLIEAIVNDKDCYVTAGHFTLSQDGRLTLTDNTGAIIVRDKNTGEIHVVSPNKVLVTAINDPQRLIDANNSMEGLRGQLIKQVDDSIELAPGTPDAPQEVGEVFVGADGKQYVVSGVPDEQGNWIWLKIELDTDGEPKGNPQPLDIDEYRKAKSDEIDAANRPQPADESINTAGSNAEGQNQAAPVPENDIQEEIQSDAKDAQQGDNAGSEARAENGTGADNPPATAMSRIPVDEKGRPQYEQAKPEDALAELVEKYGAEKAQQMILQMAEANARKAEELRNTDTSTITDMAELAAHEDAILDAERKAQYWQNLIPKPEPEKPVETPEPVAEAVEPVQEPTQQLAEPIGKTSTAEEIVQQETIVNTEPTEAQKAAGNYQKGHINVDGYDITIENPKGSIRSGVDDSGKKWEQEMHNTYGYIRGTEGVDGDHIDVFLSDNPASGNVFVIDQIDQMGLFDEHKVMYGFQNLEEAKAAYLSNYEEGWRGLGAITEVSREEFKKWVESSHRKTKPFSEYKSVEKKSEEVQQPVVTQEPPKQPVAQQPQQVVQPQLNERERKTWERKVKNAIRNTFEYPTKDGGHVEMFLERVDHEGNVVCKEQAFDANGEKIGEPVENRYAWEKLGKALAEERIKRVLSIAEKIREKRKLDVGGVSLVDVLNDKEQEQLWDAIQRGDRDEIGALESDLITTHRQDIILKGRDIRNDKVERILSESGSKEEKLKRIRDIYRGYDAAEALDDEALYPNTLEEHVAAALGNVPKRGTGTLAYHSYGEGKDKIIGLQDETGFGSRGFNGDTKGFEPWLAPKDKGVSLQRYAESLHEMLPEGLKETVTSQDVRNALLSIFSSAEKPSDIPTMIMRRGIEVAESNVRNMEESWIEDAPAFHKALRDKFHYKDAAEEHREKVLMNAVIEHLRNYGMTVVTDVKQGQADLDKYNDAVKASRNKKRALNTVVPEDESSFKATVVSSADGAKVLKNLETLAKKSENIPIRKKNSFISDVAKALGAQKKGSNSQYAKFVTDNGNEVIIRLADHNATVSQFDYRDENNGISIVISRKANEGILNDGAAHLVEIYYPDKVLKKASGNPYAEIVKSIDEALHTGEYKDQTGLAERQEVNANEVEVYRQSKVFNDVERGLRTHKVSDAEELKQMENTPTVKRYRAMQLIDGKLYPPMSGKVDGKWRTPTEIGVWEKAEERPDLVDKQGRFNLRKGLTGTGRGDTPAAYNPYFHTSTSPMNDQFTAAYARPELVVVEVEIPESELTSGYQAVGAKDHVGDIPWHSGPVNGALPEDRKRTVTLSRYNKVLRIVPDSEVADMIAKQLEGTDVEIPYNVVTKALRKELEQRGVKISATPAGNVSEDINGNPVRRQPMFQKVEQPIFVSNAMKAVDGIKQEKATPEQWLAMLQKNGGLKAGEDKWLGLSSWLKDQKGSVTKQDVMDYIRQNEIQVEETRYAEDMPEEAQEKLDAFNDEFQELIWEGEKATESIYTSDWVDWAFEQMVDRYGDDFRYAFDAVGGGTNARLELAFDYDGLPRGEALHYLGVNDTNKPIHNTRLDYTTKGLRNNKEIALTVPTIEPWHEDDEVHFGDAGEGRAVAWVRFGETSDKDGKRVLVIDEIQSKRHQEGRENGYADSKAVKAYNDWMDAKAKELGVERYQVEGRLSDEEYSEMKRLQDAAKIDSGIPDAPFDKNWHELAMKRMLRYAAENGYDKIAWTTGDQQAERYSLSKVFNSIEREDNPSIKGRRFVFSGGNIENFIVDEDGKVIDSTINDAKGKSLSDLVGKDLAVKMMGLEDGDVIDGEKLAIGGEGMKGFYDDMLPRFMNKYGKKWGVQVHDLHLPGIGDSTYRLDANGKMTNGVTMHSVDVTPEMKESVMQGQPMFFKTSNGEAYGYTLHGKMYVDPRIANSETPIHEYGHLWAEMKRQSAPEEWNEIKNVLLNDKLTAPIINKVREEYAELTKEGREDDFVEEILTQFSGKRGAERLREVAEQVAKENGGTFGKAEAITAMQRLKNIINRFWESVAKMFGVKYRNANDVADMVMKDFLNGVNPNELMESTDNTLRSERELERTLMGVHNISEDKLRKVIKAGGLANPSLAVVDTKQGIHTQYGEISLIPKSSLIDKRTGRNAGTFSGDAWTPTYPHVESMLTKQGEKRAAEIAKEVAGEDEEMARHIRSCIFDYFDGNGDRLHFLFLKQKGLNPEVRMKRTSHSQDEFDAITKIFGEERTGAPSGNNPMTKEQSDALLKLMLDVYEKKLREKETPGSKFYERIKQLNDERMEEYRKELTDENGRIWFAPADTFIYENWKDEKQRRNPEPDWYGTDNDASYQVAKEGLAEEYEKWKESLMTDEEVEEKLFAGYTPSGYRRYLPNTVENASRLMNKNNDQNAYDEHGFGPTRSMLLQNFASLAEIRRHKDLIQKDDAVKERTEELSNELFDIIKQISAMQKISDNPFMNNDYAEARLQEAMGTKNPIRHLNKEYGYKIPEDGELASQLMNFMEDVKNLPAKYFETKFKRPVTLDEFEIAIVPENTAQEVIDALRDAGLDVRTYDASSHGDEADENRRRVTMEAVQGRRDIMFQKAPAREEILKDEERGGTSEGRERLIAEMPMKSSDRFNGKHVIGLEEYENELRKQLAANSMEGAPGNHPSSSDNYISTDGFWSPKEEVASMDSGHLGRDGGLSESQDGRRLGLTPEKRQQIELELEAIAQEKENRKHDWEVFAKKYHVGSDGWISQEDYLKAFEDMNTDPEAKRLMDKVIDVLNGDLGRLYMKAGLKKRGSHNNSIYDSIEISQDWIARGVDNSQKARTLLHELIHKVTLDNIELYDIPGIRNLMGKEAKAAIKELYAIHDALKKQYPDLYGSANLHEMVAEMGEPELREALKNIVYDKNNNITGWDKFKEAVKRIFGFKTKEEEKNGADKAALDALDKLLDSYNERRSIIQRVSRTTANVLSGKEGEQAPYYLSEETGRSAAERAVETEIGGALVDRLSDMGMDVSTDWAENRRVLKKAALDFSENGKVRQYKTPDGKTYGFVYNGKMYLDPRKIDAELPIHEYGHLWSGAFRKLNPKGWQEVVDTLKGDKDSWEAIKQLNTHLTDDHDIAEEMIAKYSGEKGAERLRAELERLSKRDESYKSRWGNIYQNISKAIQDFWKKIGDFLHIKYETPDQIYDQVMKDFADKVNPQSMVERYLQERDAEYMKAVEDGNTEKAAEIFNEALRENIGNGITPYLSVDKYFANRELAHAVKTRDEKAVREAAEKIAPLIPKDAVLVPAPSHTGEATDMLDVAKAISEITGADVADVLKGSERTPQYEAKKAGEVIPSEEMGISVQGELPKDKIPVVIDNVVDTGNTAEACVKALGKGIVCTLGDSADSYDHVASLKSAEPVVKDRKGNVVPLSERFEMGGSKYLAKAKKEAPVADEPAKVEAAPVEPKETPVEEYRKGDTFDIVDNDNERMTCEVIGTENGDVLVNIDGYGIMAVEKDELDVCRQRAIDTRNDEEVVKQKEAEKKQAEEVVDQWKKANDLLKKSKDDDVSKRATKAVLKALDKAGVPYKVVNGKEERQMLSLYAKMNQDAVADFARALRDEATDELTRNSRYVVIDMDDPFAVPQFYQKMSTAKFGLDNMRSFISEGNWKIIDIGAPNEKAVAQPTEDGVRKAALVPNIEGMVSWHGSGSDFDRFDHRHMGEGEGNQSYGWGTYVTDVEGIGRMYAESMGGRHKPATYKGMSAIAIRHLSKDFFDFIGVTDEAQREQLEQIVSSLNYGYGDPVRMLRARRESLQATIERKESVLEEQREKLNETADEQEIAKITKSIQRRQQNIDKTKALLDFVNSLDPKDFQGWGKQQNSHLYKVEIPEDTGDNYFDWTQNVPEERADAILSALRKKLLADDKYRWNDDEASIKRLDDELERMRKFFGATFYGRMSVLLGNSVAGADIDGKRLASELLHDNGYVGIKYPAEYMSGGRKDGAMNHVIFDENDAKITDHIEFMTDKKNQIYGWSDGKSIHLTKAGLNPNTPIHEYTHLWDKYIQEADPELWKKVISAMKKTTMWEEIRKNPSYRNIWDDEDRMASEVHSRLSGLRGEAEFMQAAFKKDTPQAIINEVKSVLRKFWNTLLRLFGKQSKTFAGEGESIDAIIRRPLKDLLEGLNPVDELENAGVNDEWAEPMMMTGEPAPELTPEERQYWNQWSAAMKKWRERNAIPADTDGPGEKPKYQQGQTALDYAKVLMQYNKRRALWETAPKLEDYRQARSVKDAVEVAREKEKKYPDSTWAKTWRISAEMQRIRSAMRTQKQYDKSTVKAVTDLAHDLMTMGFGDNLSRGEMERILSSVKNATGAKDIKKQVDNVMNILIDNQLRNLDQRIVKLSSIKELKQTAQGVEAQGKLELKGQKMIQAFREAREGRMDADRIRERLNEVAEKMDSSEGDTSMLEQEYEGLMIALQYQENIEGSREEWADLNTERKDAVANYKTSGRSYQAQQELLESLDQAMMENKIERIGIFGDIIGRLEGNISESIQGAKEFVEREKERVKRIHDLANFDTAGKDMGAMRVDKKGKAVEKGRPANFFLQPLGTFEQMLKQFGGRNANGEGYLYDYFLRNWMDATDKAFVNETKAKDELDAKARELFGKGVKRWSDLYEISNKEGAQVDVVDQNEKKTLTLTQGNLLYIYMADKMSDGRMKLRKMGITEEQVEQIKEHLDPRLIQLTDWIQDEYLPAKRTEYNKVHERMFGAPMASIEHYFPIKILGDARVQEQDVANMADQDTVLPSTITGNIIKRRRNALPLDILHTDALSLTLEHIEDMERWAATAEWNKDINTLLSYTTFRNKVKNMKTIYGSGDEFWNAFADTARMAAGTYRPKAKPGSVDAAISNIAKGVTAAKINFRVYTAFKQILSAPAFLHDVNIGNFIKDGLNPYGSWKWAMENMPVFRKRWKSRQIGDTRLMDDPSDWKLWKTNVVQMATRLGMSPNAIVDGVTCAVGAKAIYETRYKKYKQIGATDEVARKRALQDAEIGYNLTQQSSEGAFVSKIQKDRTVAANMLTVFRNSSMSYTRQWYDAYRNLRRRMQSGYKEDSIDFMARQIQEQFNLNETEARQAAEAEYARAGRRDIARMLNMMFGVTIAWNLGASLPYLLMGDDDKTKKEMMTDALLKGMIAGPTEGFAAGNIYSDFVSQATNEGVRKAFKDEGGWGAVKKALDNMGDQDVNPLPLFADMERMIGKMKYDGFAAAQDVFNICTQSAVGVNPQTFTDMWNACMDYGFPGWDGTNYKLDEENLQRPKEIALFIMRLMNAPTSSWRNKYIDELGMDVESAKKLSYEEMAKRYAHYKHWKDVPMLGWLRGEEGRQKKIEKIQEQFDKAVYERVERLTDKELLDNLAKSTSYDERRQYAKLIHSRIGGNGKDAQNAKEDWQKNYQMLMQYNDIKEDELLSKKKAEAKANGDEKTVKTIEKAETKIREKGKKKLNGDNDAEVMENIRQWRGEALEKVLRNDQGPIDPNQVDRVE